MTGLKLTRRREPRWRAARPNGKFMQNPALAFFGSKGRYSIHGADRFTTASSRSLVCVVWGYSPERIGFLICY